MSTSPRTIAKLRRKVRIRKSIYGTPQRPRMSVYISLSQVTAQIIDDSTGKTLASAQSKTDKSSLTKKAALVGTQIAEAAKKAKVSKVSLDRNGRQYQGRMKALAEAARKSGLEF